MTRSMYEQKGCIGEYNFQVPLLHDSVDPVVEVVVRVGNLHCDIHFHSVLFKKTDFTGTEVDAEVEVYELLTKSTGGVPDATTLTANIDREARPLGEDEGIGLFYDDAGTPLVIDDTGALIMLRESGFAIKGVASRPSNLDLKYSLKPNTDYLIRSTVVNGPTDASRNVIIGFLRIASEYVKE